MLFGWLMTFYTVPEALAVPYADQVHGGAKAAGLLFAAQPFGIFLGSAVVSRLLGKERRIALMAPMAILCCGLAAAVPCRSRPCDIAGNPGGVRGFRRLPGRRELRFRGRGTAASDAVRPSGSRSRDCRWVRALPRPRGGGGRYHRPTTVTAISGGLGAIVAIGITLGQRRALVRVARPVESSVAAR